MHRFVPTSPTFRGVAIFRALIWACVWLCIGPVAAASSQPPPPSSAARFNQAVFEFHQAEQEGLAPDRYLALLASLDARFAKADPQRRIVLDAERCTYMEFADHAAAAHYISNGIERAIRARMPVAETMFRLCELTLQSDALELAALDGVIARFNALESPYQKAEAFALRADVNSVRGNLADALLDYQRARAAYARAGVSGAERNIFTGEAIARRRMGDLAGAQSALTSVLPFWQAAGNARELAYAHIQLAYVHSEAGDQTAALEALSLAMSEAKRANDPDIISKTLLGRGLVQARSADWASALASTQAARSMLSPNDLTAQYDLALADYVEGMALGHTGRPSEALRLLDRSETAFAEQKNNRLAALVLKAKGDVLSSLHQPAEALAVYRRYMDMELQLQKKMRVEQSALLRQEFEIQSQAFETRQLRINRLNQERELASLKTTRRWQGLALLATLFSLLVVGHFALNQWRRGKKLNRLAHLDPLTRLANRSGVENFADAQMLVAKSSATPLSVLILDLDHFKAINDTYGHLVGDIVLKEVTREWSNVLRTNDLLGRFGGEEFLAVCPGLDLATARAVAERLRTSALELQLGAIDPDLRVTVSIGVAQYVPNETRIEWIHRADRALYVAKQNGRNRVEVADTSR